VELTGDQNDLFDGDFAYAGYGEIDGAHGFGLRADIAHASFNGTESYDAAVSTAVGSPVRNDLGVTAVLGDLLYRIPVPEEWSGLRDIEPTLYAGVGSYGFHRSRESALPARDTPPGIEDDTRKTKFGWNAGVGLAFATGRGLSITALYRYHFILTDEDAFDPSGIGAADERTDYHEGLFGVKARFGPGGIREPSGGD
jgi:hypothetical protein